MSTTSSIRKRAPREVIDKFYIDSACVKDLESFEYYVEKFGVLSRSVDKVFRFNRLAKTDRLHGIAAANAISLVNIKICSA